MSLSITIDETKVKQTLDAANKPEYVVTASNIAPTAMRAIGPISNVVSGTAIADETPKIDIQRFVLGLRRNIEDSGVPLETPEELEREINEMRERYNR